MADSGPSRRHGWIPRVRVIPGNGLDSFGDLPGTNFQPCLGAAARPTQCRWIKKCTSPAEGLDFWEVSSGPFRTVFGVPRPLKVGGLCPPTFPETSRMGLRTICSFFDFKKSISGARFLIPKFLIRPVGCNTVEDPAPRPPRKHWNLR